MGKPLAGSGERNELDRRRDSGGRPPELHRCLLLAASGWPQEPVRP